ncbi:2-hydroxyacyl-CoA dehydratase family protein [Sphingomonas endolithica]|uniref:2-hydroxyacyl-CoA dehydratase family protein n=1 Tax=Sphingomonas endolithica TaxID=2972485 RepID=UPI0021B04A0D|nr:2-hydroxyacyl-CoA dehydratase family protein [Sphingomonas sp. ZFBP2030]
MSADPFAPLLAAYDDPDAVARAALAAGRRVIRTIGADAPRELLLAAGYQPVRLAPATGETPRADAVMGQKGLGARGRAVLEALLDPAQPGVPVLFTSADAELVQVFATIRDLARLGDATPPPIALIDLGHLPRETTRAYNVVRLAELDAWLRDLGTGPALPDADVGKLLALDGRRRAMPARLSGTTMLKLIGSLSVVDAATADAALSPDADVPARDGPRVYIVGSPHETARSYEAIEALGATIVGEDHDWGRRALVGGDPADPAIRRPSAVTPPAEIAARVIADAAACQATHIVHLTIGADEAAPWTAAAVRRAIGGALPFLATTDTAIEDIAAFLAGQLRAAPPPKLSRPAPPRTPGAADKTRSRKSLTSLEGFGTYQREWFAGVRARAAEGEPFAVVNANAPQEILRALDIPFVVNQWWASIVAAKQQSRRYLGLLSAHDYPAKVEPYSAQGLAASFDDDPDQAPWGGLPKPNFVHAVLSSDATAGIFSNWADETGAAPYLYERTVDPNWTIATNWWDDLPDGWEEALEPARLDLLTAELRDVIAQLEAATDRVFEPARFEAVMHLVNEQEEYYRRTRDLIARTVPAPIGIVDSMPATMVPQWHRGTQWARDAAKAFYEEVAQRVADGASVVPEERVRLMFVGRGMWSDMGFYQRWEESHGAVFVWSMYLGLAADGYIRHFDRGRDPLRALAARFLTMGDELRMPSWAAPWHVHEAQTHQVDGAMALDDADPFVIRALVAAGIPVLELGVDNFALAGDDAAALHDRITAFIEGPAGARAEARRTVAP